MFVGINLGINQLRGSVSFSPASLFALAEPGVWFDPSDLTTLFQDPAGTTPVTAPGQTVGLMLDKSKGLALGAELVANGTFDTNIDGWTADGSYPPASAVWSSGSMVVTGNAGNHSAVKSPMTTVVGKSYRITASVTGLGYTSISNSSTGGWSPLSAVGYFVATATTTYIVAAVQPIVGAVATFDNISVRELAGNHATQATLAARPTYSIEPVGGRRNLLTWSEDFRNTADAGSLRPWVYTNVTVGPNSALAPDGTMTADTLTATANSAYTSNPWSATGAASYINSVYVRRRTGVGQIFIYNPAVSAASQIAVTSEWTRFSGPTSATSGSFVIQLQTAGDQIDVWGAQGEAGSTATAYQRVTTQHDVTEAGVASVSYLYFDGSDDHMVTSTITPATDKAQVFTGVRKLSDAQPRGLLDYGPSWPTYTGSFAIYAPSYITGGLPAPKYSVAMKGAAGQRETEYATYTAPITNVLSTLFDISEPAASEILMRIDGVVIAPAGSGGSAITGNFNNLALQIGRIGTGASANVHLYSLITRFGPTLDTPTITSTEIWVGDKTGIDVAKNISTTIYTRSGDTILDRANSTIERRA